jgi:hypothetical protein
VDADAIAYEKQARWREMIGMTVLIGAVWVVALTAPFAFSWQDLSFDWIGRRGGAIASGSNFS